MSTSSTSCSDPAITHDPKGDRHASHSRSARALSIMVVVLLLAPAPGVGAQEGAATTAARWGSTAEYAGSGSPGVRTRAQPI